MRGLAAAASCLALALPVLSQQIYDIVSFYPQFPVYRVRLQQLCHLSTRRNGTVHPSLRTPT